jgi:peptidoglycan glycosyltransferase
MSRQIRRVATLMLVLFGAMFVNLNIIQLVRADDLAENPANRRLLVREYAIERGPIVAGDREVVHSESTDDDLEYLRVYEDPHLWSHITGFYSFILGRSGLEAAMNDELRGTPTELLAQNLAGFLGRTETGNTVQLTIDPRVQAAARDALGDRVGAVVALEPTTGAVLASYSNPTYDPNLLTSHDARSILDNWAALQAAPGEPLLDRVTRATYPPGSTFKVITAAAALESGLEPDTALADLAAYSPPQTSHAIRNFSPGPCTGGSTITLADSLRVSCNTSFAKLGVDLGADALIQTAERFGFNRTPPYVLPTVKSQIPKELDPPATAQSAIGQRDVRITPLQAAMVAASIANEGRVMRPHLVSQVREAVSGRPLAGPDTGLWSEGRFDGQAVSPQTAQQLREMMVQVVADGTGRQAQIAGVEVGGKTGTAQVPDQTQTVWFIGFAGDRVAVAVVLPDAGGDATGGGVAAPIARAVMQAALSAGG